MGMDEIERGIVLRLVAHIARFKPPPEHAEISPRGTEHLARWDGERV
jgi:hypothetical protein